MGWSGKASDKGRFEQRLGGDEGVRQVGVPAGGEGHPEQRQLVTPRRPALGTLGVGGWVVLHGGGLFHA